MTPPLTFSITIPAGPDFDPRLGECLASLDAQDEAIAVALCDCSDAQEVHQLAEDYQKMITYRRHGPDDGQAAAIKEGWAAVSGDILGWLNVDDRLTDGALCKVASFFRDHPDIDVVYGQSLIVTDDAEPFLHPEVSSPSESLYYSNNISQPSCFVRRSAIEAIGGIDPTLHFVMDWDLWVRLRENGAKFHYTPDVLSEVYFGEGTKTGTLGRARLREIWRVLRRNCGRVRSLKSVTGFALAHHGIYRRAGETANSPLSQAS
ncbi:glycosyltransferase [Parvularcula marina]|uniref:glycosyltransferase n=1 Tax=Parvularcula marina TaxID=2292771 RepID=UPI003518C036